MKKDLIKCPGCGVTMRKDIKECRFCGHKEKVEVPKETPKKAVKKKK